MDQVTSKPLDPALLKRLVPAKVFFEQHANIFPSKSAGTHFLRTRRDELIARDLLVVTTIGIYVDGQALSDQLLDLLSFVPEAGKRRPKPETEAV